MSDNNGIEIFVQVCSDHARKLCVEETYSQLSDVEKQEIMANVLDQILEQIERDEENQQNQTILKKSNK